MRSGSIRRAGSVSMLGRRPAASPMSSSSAARSASTPSTSGAASSPNPSAATSGSSRWSGRTREPSPRARSRSRSTSPSSTSRSSRSGSSSGRSRRRSARVQTPRSSPSSSPSSRRAAARTDHGVVRDPAIHREVLERVIAAAGELGLGARDVIASPILGPEGNREFLVHFRAGPGCAEIGDLVRQVTAP